jgi:hypothetical protein
VWPFSSKEHPAGVVVDVRIVQTSSARPASDSPGDRLVISGNAWEAVIDPSKSRVEAVIDDESPNVLLSLLKVVAQVFPPVLGIGLTLHASAVERHGQAFVFMGKSGAGKSTIALESLERGFGNILSDELTFVGEIGDERVPRTVSLPFPHKRSAPVHMSTAPLRAVFTIQQADEDEVVPLDIADQVRAVCSAAAIGVRASQTMEPALAMSQRLVRRVPVRRLRFRVGSGFWAAIDEVVPRFDLP